VIGLVLRRATVQDAPAIGRVRVNSWRATYRGIMPDEYLDGMEVEDSIELWAKVLSAQATNTSVFVAELSGEIIGFAAGTALAETKFGIDTELAAIYLRPDVQRSGIGSRLLNMVADAHRSQGATGLLVWVLAANKAARRFFEELGAELLIQQSYQWDDLDLVEVGYGWPDLSALAESCNR
jgi:GNAT superfamily N-acetyltransferase